MKKIVHTARKVQIQAILRKTLWFIPIGVLGHLIITGVTTEQQGWQAVRNFDSRFLILALLLGFVQWQTNTFRIIIWTRFLKYHFSYPDMLKLVIGSELGSAISPTALGGGYVKLGMLISKGLSSGQAASLMTLGTVEDAIFFSIVIPICLFLGETTDLPILGDLRIHLFEKVSTQLPALLISILVFILFRNLLRLKWVRNLSLIMRIKSWFKHLAHDFVIVYRMIAMGGKWRLLTTVSLSGIQYICRYGIIMAVLSGFAIPYNVFQIFFFQWAIYVLTILVPTPGGAGGAEIFFYFIFSSFVPSDIIGVLTTGWRFLSYYIQLTVGTVVFMILQIQDDKKGRLDDNDKQAIPNDGLISKTALDQI